MAESQIIIEGEEFTCPSVTDAKFVGKKPYGSAYGNLKVYIPALMKEITMDKAKTLTAVSINKTMLSG